MREILFKAKRLDNGKWVEGYYSKSPHPFSGFIKDFIFAPYYDKEQEVGYDNGYMVDVSTLCQYTGLTDKKGNRIWENDVVYVRCRGLSGKGFIAYVNGCLALIDAKKQRTYSLFGEWELRVDGNIFENPELVGCE